MTVSIAGVETRGIRIEPSAWPWIAVLVFTALCLALRSPLPWLVAYPKEWILPVAVWINDFFDVFITLFKPVFRGITALLDGPMRGVRACLQWVPWPVTMVVVAGLALRASGWKLAVFAVVSLAYLVLIGYWRQSMNTLAIVIMAVPLSVIAGFALGVLAERLPRLRAAVEALLDLMQTVPAFAYLIPLLLLFGFGPVVGLIASAIYAMPPMVRNTMLGLRLVPPNIKEAGEMSGCTRWQQFWHVEFPSALPQMLVGFNQTTMAALSMVIIDAIIGGFEDIGWEVLSSMRKAEFGQSLLSGLVIALMAILIDRITIGFARRRAAGVGQRISPLDGNRLRWFLGAAFVAALLLRLFAPEGGNPLPDSSGMMAVSVLNEKLLGFVATNADWLEALKNGVLYCLMLPLRLGINGAASPAIWGFTLSPLHIIAYAALVAAFISMLLMSGRWQAAVATAIAALLIFYGFVGFPWPAFMAIIGVAAFAAGGWRIAAFAVCGLAFILVTGLWLPLMQSVYLTVLAVVLCLLIGGALGVWAAHDDRVSRILRPVNDALQTMPQFVFLIPALMFFKVGEFTALIAIMLYAIVPPIRYVEHGLRTVRPDVVEAARQMGSTPAQLLWQVKLPLALPVVMLGLNQTIMAALSMLVIAAMVGTRELGQLVYVALGKADAGLGLISGLSIALVAMISDRIIQARYRSEITANPGK